MALTPETRQASDELTKHFLVPFSLEQEAKAIRDCLPLLPDSFRGIAETFTDRLSATIQTTAAPFLLANQAAHDKQYQRFSMAERIRAGSIEKEPNESEDELEVRRNQAAQIIANSKMDTFCKSEEGIDSLVAETSRFLLHLNNTPVIQSVAREILLQGTVATWSALEMLVSDELTLLLDNRPDLVAKLLSDPIAKRKFELPKLNVDDLALRGFDLSKQMGHLLFEERDLSSLPTLKCACEALIDAASLREKLAAPSAWHLNQNRHLIVHRRGIVDEEYLRKTGAKLSVGDQLVVSPDAFEELLLHALSIGSEFLAGLVSLVMSNPSINTNATR
ncbi:MAG: hypothetical protein HOP24_04250 [Sideroxydans sp.]|nr:hypothetical protein [Sideroxydans sp.]